MKGFKVILSLFQSVKRRSEVEGAGRDGDSDVWSRAYGIKSRQTGANDAVRMPHGGAIHCTINDRYVSASLIAHHLVFYVTLFTYTVAEKL